MLDTMKTNKNLVDKWEFGLDKSMLTFNDEMIKLD